MSFFITFTFVRLCKRDSYPSLTDPLGDLVNRIYKLPCRIAVGLGYCPGLGLLPGVGAIARGRGPRVGLGLLFFCFFSEK